MTFFVLFKRTKRILLDMKVDIIMRSLMILTYKEKEHSSIVSLLKELIKDNMTMFEVRNYLLELKLTQDEVDFIMKNHYTNLI